VKNGVHVTSAHLNTMFDDNGSACRIASAPLEKYDGINGQLLVGIREHIGKESTSAVNDEKS